MDLCINCFFVLNARTEKKKVSVHYIDSYDTHCPLNNTILLFAFHEKIQFKGSQLIVNGLSHIVLV